jgi:hypothetical protein
MRLKRFLVLFGASLFIIAVLVVCLAPFVVPVGLRWWVSRLAGREGLQIEFGKIEAPFLHPMVIHDVRIASTPDAAFLTTGAAPRLEMDLNFWAIFDNSRGRLLRSFTADSITLDIRRNPRSAPQPQHFAWRFFEGLLADNFKLSGVQLHVENGPTVVDVRDGIISGSEIEAGIFSASEITISSPWLQKSFSHLRGATSWQESRLTIGALSLMRGLDLDAISIDLSRIGESRIGFEMSLDAFGGKIRASLSSEDRGAKRTWDAAGTASEISLAQMSDALDWTNRASGSLHACKFTFRGEASNLREATATLWAEVTGLTWRDRTADTVMLGVSLYNRQVQIEQLYIKQRNNEFTLTGEAALPQRTADWLKPDFRGDISASINDLGDFARLFGATPSDFAGKIAVNGSLNAREKKLGGQLAFSGNALVLFRTPIESLNIKLGLKESHLELTQFDFRHEKDSFAAQATVDLTGEHAYSGTLTTSIAEARDYAGLIPDALAPFRLAGSVNLDWKGTGNDVTSSGAFHLQGHDLRPPQSLLIPFDAEFEGEYAADKIFFRQFHLSNQHADFSAFVTVAKDYFQLQSVRLDLNGKPKLQGNIFLPFSLSKLHATNSWLGALSDDPRSDVDVTLDPIDLAELAVAVTTQPRISGKAAGRIELYGTTAALEGKSDLHLRDFVFGDDARLSADLETRLTSKILGFKANAIASGSDPVKMEGSIPWRIEKGASGHALNTAGPLSATLNFPVIFLAKFPRYLSHGIFLDGILGGNLTISDSLQHPRVTGESHLIGGRLADGSSLAFGLTFGGQSATLDFVRLAQRGIDRFAHGEIGFTDLTAIAVKILPNESILETSPLSAGDCVSSLELSATTVTGPPQHLPIDEIDFRGNLFDRAWTISLSGRIPDDPYRTLRAPVTRTFPFCRESEASRKPLTLGLAPVAFP